MSRLTPTDVQRESLKRPLGELVTGTPSECTNAFRRAIAIQKPGMVVLVGDAVSRNSIQFGIRADVIIIDNREERHETVQFNHRGRHLFTATNPAGEINMEAWKIVHEAVAKRDSLVLIDGEEDLLTLVAILAVTPGSLVVYGQPGQGIVIVRADHEKKLEVQRIIEGMERRG